MGRIPTSVSRRRIHAGEAADASTPRTTRATKRSHPARPWIGASSARRTAYPPSFGAATGSSAGSSNGAPVDRAYSRAMPRIEKQ